MLDALPSCCCMALSAACDLLCLMLTCLSADKLMDLFTRGEEFTAIKGRYCGYSYVYSDVASARQLDHVAYTYKQQQPRM